MRLLLGDTIRSTATIRIENEDDLDELQFEDEFMQDCDGEGLPEGPLEKVSNITLLFSKCQITQLRVDTHITC